MAGELLLDTGALVSLLDRSQSRHRDFVDFFDAWAGPVVSTEAVLAEASHEPSHEPSTMATARGTRLACAFDSSRPSRRPPVAIALLRSPMRARPQEASQVKGTTASRMLTPADPW